MPEPLKVILIVASITGGIYVLNQVRNISSTGLSIPIMCTRFSSVSWVYLPWGLLSGVLQLWYSRGRNQSPASIWLNPGSSLYIPAAHQNDLDEITIIGR